MNKINYNTIKMDDENFNKTFLAKQLVQALRVSSMNNKKLISKMQEGDNISEDESKRIQNNINIMNCLNELLSR